MREKIVKGKNGIKVFILTFALVMYTKFNIITAYAGGLSGSKLVTGTTNLLNDAMNVAQVMGLVICGVLLLYFAIRSGMAQDDEQERKSWKKAMKYDLVVAVIVVAGAQFIQVITGYYK